MSDQGFSRRRFLTAAGAAMAASTLSAAVGASARQSLRDREVKHWDMSTDVLVAGSGVAGMAAAIDARRGGAEVLVLEMQANRGGSSAMSGGICYLGGGTPLQKALGFEDSVENMYNYMVAASGPYPHTDRIQAYCEGSIDHFHWLVNNGVTYTQKFQKEKEFPENNDDSLYYSGCELNYPFNTIAKPAPRGHKPGVLGHAGWRMMQCLEQVAEREGVKVLLEVSCERLIQADDGSVTGLMVQQGGKTRYVRARKGVVLACGGFIRNREMVKLHAPEVFDVSSPHGSMGDLGMGILMGMGAGASAIRMNQAMIVLPLYPPENVLKGIFVNAQGQRFMAEDYYYGVVGTETVIRQKGLMYLVSDADHAYETAYLYKEAGQANSIAELEKQVGFPEGALQATVNYYNSHAAKGQDPQFNKQPAYIAPISKPPFRAYRVKASEDFAPILTFGGLQTNTDAQVINAFGEVIPGLYAAGRTVNGIPAAPYMASGLSVGDSSFFGRRAGRHAASRR